MKLTCAGTKKSPTYYVQKSIRIGNKATTKTVERLGSIEEIKARCGDLDPIEWAKEYTKKLTLAEKESRQGIVLKYSASTLIDKTVRRSYNAGYLFLQDIYYALELDRICATITTKYKFDYDLNDILSMLVYSRIISPASKFSSDIIKINHNRWEIEECFRIMKTEFKARPVYLSRKDRITAHFTTCFTALVIYRILEKRLNQKYTCENIIHTLGDMDMLIAPGEGYIPTYTRTDVTDALHEAFGFRTDYQITSQKNMRKILNQTRKKEK